MYIDKTSYYFKPEALKLIEEKYNAKHMGFWCTKRPDGSWNERPVDIFYVENPDRSKGHSNYFGMFTDRMGTMITNAESAFSETITGVLCEDGEVLVSRYRHDYRTKGTMMIDGGRDYLKMSSPGHLVDLSVVGGEFLFKEVD